MFAWSHDDMRGISPEVITHCLSINPQHQPIHPKCRAYDPIKYAAMKTKVDKLQKINFIRPMDYPRWLSNAVMVQKAHVR